MLDVVVVNCAHERTWKSSSAEFNVRVPVLASNDILWKAEIQIVGTISLIGV